jgi:chemotaxis protein methyltransferase CheR
MERPLSHREFRLFQELIHRETGIFLAEVKKPLLVSRLSRRLRTLGDDSFGAYYERVMADDAERIVMLDHICTNETKFFREPRQFEFLDRQVLPQWRGEAGTGVRAKRVRAWSAACSTGEEPYSIAMLLRTHLRAEEGWAVEVLASDLSTKALANAREGLWPVERADDIPDAYKRAYMMRGIRGESGNMRARPEVKTMIDFRRVNLNDPEYDVGGGFDLIFCRNVLIYFNQATKAAVVERLASRLSPGGLLFLGHSETLNPMSGALRHAGPTVYQRT